MRQSSEILQLLTNIANKYPYLNMGQIITIAIDNEPNLFYVDDDRLLDGLKDFDIKLLHYKSK
jgi:hypothetical protein